MSTLQHAHKLGIIHGDVKPENIVTTTKQSFYLIDWGEARYKSHPVQAYARGTPAYMSLRVLKGECMLALAHLSSTSFTNPIQRTTSGAI